MADRSVTVRLRAEAAQFKAETRDAAKAMRDLGQAAEQSQGMVRAHAAALREDAERTRRATEAVGKGLVAFGGATVTALGAAAMAAQRWESDWTGVLKTVEGTSDELAGVEGGLRELARTLPATHTEIAAVAEAAGQLGVRTKDVVGFTRVMIDLGETTNLTADEAATAIAQLMNVMRTAPQDVDRLASALVELGNNGASTERDIILMAQRIAGAGAVVGLTEAEVLGLANALASVGIEVEAGGSAISRVLTDMAMDVSQGGDALEAWARVAGVTGQQFADTWRRAPAEALQMFIGGLGRMKAAGQDVFGVLDSLGQTDVRVSRALLTMATSGDLLAESLDMGARAWEENSALAEEAGKRYDTTAAKVEIARNNLNDAAIEIGEVFLPAIVEASEAVAGFAGWLAGLPVPVQQVAGGLGALTGAAALLGGAFLLAFPRVMDTVEAFRRLREDNPRVAAGLGRVAKAAYQAGVVFATVRTAAALYSATIADAALGTEELRVKLEEIADGGDAVDIMFSDLTRWSDSALFEPQIEDVDRLRRNLQALADPNFIQSIQGGIARFAGFWDSEEIGRYQARLRQVGEDLGALATTDARQAIASFRGINDALGGGEETARQLLETMPAFRDALIGVADGSELATDDATLLAIALGEIEVAAPPAVGAAERLASQMEGVAEAEAAATEALQEWRDMVAASDASFVDLAGAYQSVIDKNTEYAQSTADATKSSDDSWQDYYDGVTVSADDYIAQLQAQVDAQTNWETNMLEITRRVNEGMTGEMRDAGNAMIDELLDLGPEGAAMVAMLRTMSEPEFERVVDLWRNQGALAVGEFVSEVEGYRQPEVDVTANTTPAESTMRDFVNRRWRSTVVFDFSAGAGLTPRVVSLGQWADGGPVWGPGTETSDSIPALLSRNEHIWSAAEVRGAGGHAVVAELRALARMGALAPVTTMRFADGGSPAYAGAAMAASSATTFPTDGWSLTGRLEMGTDGLVSLVDARLSRMVSDARRQARQRDGLGVR